MVVTGVARDRQQVIENSYWDPTASTVSTGDISSRKYSLVPSEEEFKFEIYIEGRQPRKRGIFLSVRPRVPFVPRLN